MNAKTIKIWLTAAAGTAAAFIAADASGLINMPDKLVHWLGAAAAVVGIFGASPLGRLIFKDPPADAAGANGQ